jgi:DNA-binding transcriptional ArsR family regulator
MVVKSTEHSTMQQSTTDDLDPGKRSPTDRRGTPPRSRTDPEREPSTVAHRFAEDRPIEDDSDSVSVDPADLLSVLEDEHARRILNVVSDHPRPARELVEECDASRATVYRRLDRLEEQGLVTSGMEVDPRGHHRKVFEATLDEATISLSCEGFCVEVSVESPEVLADAPAGHDAATGADD